MVLLRQQEGKKGRRFVGLTKAPHRVDAHELGAGVLPTRLARDQDEGALDHLGHDRAGAMALIDTPCWPYSTALCRQLPPPRHARAHRRRRADRPETPSSPRSGRSVRFRRKLVGNTKADLGRSGGSVGRSGSSTMCPTLVNALCMTITLVTAVRVPDLPEATVRPLNVLLPESAPSGVASTGPVAAAASHPNHTCGIGRSLSVRPVLPAAIISAAVTVGRRVAPRHSLDKRQSDYGDGVVARVRWRSLRPLSEVLALAPRMGQGQHLRFSSSARGARPRARRSCLAPVRPACSGCRGRRGS